MHDMVRQIKAIQIIIVITCWLNLSSSFVRLICEAFSPTKLFCYLLSLSTVVLNSVGIAMKMYCFRKICALKNNLLKITTRKTNYDSIGTTLTTL